VARNKKIKGKKNYLTTKSEIVKNKNRRFFKREPQKIETIN
jgi:hypothetical protein